MISENVNMSHPARVLAAKRQIEEMELTRDEITAMLKRMENRDSIAAQVIAEAARQMLAGE